MKTITRRLAAWTWIACFAILFAALAPSVSNAVSASRGQPLGEICSASGVKSVQASVGHDDSSDPATRKSLHLEHCLFCATHADSLALLPGVDSAIALVKTGDIHLSLFFHPVYRQSARSTPQSRAPPV